MRSIYPSCFSEWLCAGHGTRLKGEPTISNYGSQGKSQVQPNGGEGHSVVTTRCPVTVPRKAVALLRQGTAKVRGDEQKSSQACMSGTSPATGGIKSSIHYKLCPYTRHPRTERHVFTPGGLPCACGRKWLRAGQPAPTAWKKSAEGTVAAGETSPAGAGRTSPRRRPERCPAEWCG